jgi:hypothetical protein
MSLLIKHAVVVKSSPPSQALTEQFEVLVINEVFHDLRSLVLAHLTCRAALVIITLSGYSSCAGAVSD